MSLQLKYDMTDAVMFAEDGNNVHLLVCFKKNISWLKREF
jgi:hypothetical protein